MVSKSNAAKISKETYLPKTQRTDVGEWEYVKKPSSNQIAVYFNPGLNEYIISHRGTKLEDNSDLVADLELALGTTGRSKFFKRRNDKTKGLVEDIKDADPDSKITLTGHSLGGSSAIHAMNDPFINKHVDKVITFNPGVSPIHEKFEGSPGKIENHINFRDPITSFGPHVGKVNVNKPKKDIVFKFAGDIAEKLSGNKVLGDIVGDLSHHSIDHFI